MDTRQRRYRSLVLGAAVLLGLGYTVTTLWAEYDYWAAAQANLRRDQASAINYLVHAARIAPGQFYTRDGAAQMAGMDLRVPDDVAIPIIESALYQDPNSIGAMSFLVLRYIHAQRQQDAYVLYRHMRGIWPCASAVIGFAMVFQDAPAHC